MKSGIKVKWYVIGEGCERLKLQSLINKKKLKDDFLLLGSTANPYKFIKGADIYVQPSRFEGKSIAIEEAKILYKPIIVTNFSTASEQITSGTDGIICEMTPIGISNAIKCLVYDIPLRKSIINYLEKLTHGNEQEINNLYSIIT
jgi:glycosyltransferase involved in cell wall biosynthesis